jgi:hypothetical protein
LIVLFLRGAANNQHVILSGQGRVLVKPLEVSQLIAAGFSFDRNFNVPSEEKQKTHQALDRKAGQLSLFSAEILG